MKPVIKVPKPRTDKPKNVVLKLIAPIEVTYVDPKDLEQVNKELCQRNLEPQ